MLHETTVAWLRHRLGETMPVEAWHDSREEYNTRIKSCVDRVNHEYDVEGLCHGFYKRIDKLVLNEGGRLKW